MKPITFQSMLEISNANLSPKIHFQPGKNKNIFSPLVDSKYINKNEKWLFILLLRGKIKDTLKIGILEIRLTHLKMYMT